MCIKTSVYMWMCLEFQCTSQLNWRYRNTLLMNCKPCEAIWWHVYATHQTHWQSSFQQSQVEKWYQWKRFHPCQKLQLHQGLESARQSNLRSWQAHPWNWRLKECWRKKQTSPGVKTKKVSALRTARRKSCKTKASFGVARSWSWWCCCVWMHLLCRQIRRFAPRAMCSVLYVSTGAMRLAWANFPANFACANCLPKHKHR